MKLIGILYSTMMVEAKKALRKFMTRRMRGLEKINENPDKWQFSCMGYNGDDYGAHFFNSRGNHSLFIKSPFGKPGDILWTRETFYAYGHWTQTTDFDTGKSTYKFHDLTADNNYQYLYEDCKPSVICKGRFGFGWHKRPSLFMPYAACRYWDEVLEIKVERIQSISAADVIAEGIEQLEDGDYKRYLHPDPVFNSGFTDPILSFQSLWFSINGVESWNANPWVWVVKFKPTTKPQL